MERRCTACGSTAAIPFAIADDEAPYVCARCRDAGSIPVDLSGTAIADEAQERERRMQLDFDDTSPTGETPARERVSASDLPTFGNEDTLDPTSELESRRRGPRSSPAPISRVRD